MSLGPHSNRQPFLFWLPQWEGQGGGCKSVWYPDLGWQAYSLAGHLPNKPSLTATMEQGRPSQLKMHPIRNAGVNNAQVNTTACVSGIGEFLPLSYPSAPWLEL